MAGEINWNEITGSEPWRLAIANAEKYLEVTRQTTAALIEEAKAMKAVLSANPMNSAKDYMNIASAMNASRQAMKEYSSEQDKSRKLQKQLKDATDEEVKGKIRLQQATATQKKLLTEEIALQNKEIGTLAKLKVEMARLRREREGLNFDTKEGSARLKEINAQINRNNDLIRKSGDLQKQQAMNVGNYKSALSGLNSTLLQMGIGFSLFQSLADVTDIIKRSEDAFASLSAITGLTGDRLVPFKEKIMEVSEAVGVSGITVAEAAEKIASAQPALLENADALASVTEKAIVLNKAIKGDLTETSMALVGVMNQFSLGAEEAERVINTLAAGSQAGAADVNQINESMVKFGTTAKLLNISVEESVGAIETLGEKAIFGADSGTALRNILLKMASIDVLPQKALKQLEKYGVNTDIVKDKSLSFEDRLRELSKVAKDSTAIMQIFGTENATAATVLLNSIGTYEKMTDAVTGTNVANEQAAINSNTLSATVEKLRAAWENLVIKWSEGTDVAGGLKFILNFLAENLETIISLAIKGGIAFATYKTALMLYRVETDITGKVIKSGLIPALTGAAKSATGFGAAIKSIGFAGIASILTIVVPLLFDAAHAIYEMFDNTTALDKATEKFNEKIIEERVEMDKLRFAIQTTTAGSKERQAVIDEINKRYGTTLQNIQDETLFMNQLWGAYQKVNAEMERRIMQQVLEDELKQLFKSKREAEKALGDLGGVQGGFWGVQLDEGLAETIDDIDKQISEIQAEMFKLQQQAGITGKTLSQLPGQRENNPIKVGEKEVDAEKLKLDKLSELRKIHSDELVMYENEAIKAGYDRATIDDILLARKKEQLEEELKFIQELNLKTRDEYNKTYNERIKLLDAEVKKLETIKTEKIKTNEELKDNEKSVYELMAELAAKVAEKTAEALKEQAKQIADSTKNLLDTLNQLVSSRVDTINSQQDFRRQEMQMHNDQINELRELAAQGYLTAEDSIKAEEMKTANLQNEINELERKKQNLLMINLGLQTALNLAESGDGSAITKALTQVGGFIGSLKSFYVGADDTGAGGSIDNKGGFLAINHPGEMMIQEDLASPLRNRGLDRFDVANYAMKYHDDLMNNRAMSVGSFYDLATLSALNGIAEGQESIIKELQGLPKKMPVYKQDYNVIKQVVIDTVKTDNEIKRLITRIIK